MSVRETIRAIVYAAVDEINSTRPANSQIVKSQELHLIGKAGALDSLELVNFLFAVETALTTRLGVTAELTASPELFDPGGPLTSIACLIDHLGTVVGR